MKNVIREGVAMIVLVAAIVLILYIVFFDYIKDQSNTPKSQVYTQTAEVKNILEEKKKYENETSSITLSSAYAIDSTTLAKYRSSDDLKQGQSSPFDELAITEIEYDREGNAYYKVSSDTIVKGFDYNNLQTNSVSGTSTIESTTQNYIGSTNNDTNYTFQTDINSPSQDKPLEVNQKSGK